jgi:hypothetical protein
MLTRLAFEAANTVIASAVTRIMPATAKAKAVFIIVPFTQTMPTLPQKIQKILDTHKNEGNYQ